jgi:hypothetical protein
MTNSYKWNDANFYWDENSVLWNFAQKQIIEGGHDWREDKDKKKRKQLIRLVMWRKGIKVYNEEKEVKQIDLYVDDIKLIAEEIKKNVQIIHG